MFVIVFLRLFKFELCLKLKVILVFELKVIMVNLLFLEIWYSFLMIELEKFWMSLKLCGLIFIEELMINVILNLLGYVVK